MPHRVVILAGHRRSLATILLTHALTRLAGAGVEVAAVVCVSEFSWRRIQQWRRRFGTALLDRIASEFGRSSNRRLVDERQALKDRWTACDVGYRDLPRMCRALGIPFRVVQDLNHPACIEYIRGLNTEYGIYSGGGILREPLINSVRRGILNMHCGPLPHVRGMNAAEWSLFLGLIPEVTLHYIDPGIDTGPILGARQVPVGQGDSLGSIRGRLILAGIDLLCDLLPDIEAGDPRENPATAGVQFYSMSDTLKDVLQFWIDTGITPVAAAVDVDPARVGLALPSSSEFITPSAKVA